MSDKARAPVGPSKRSQRPRVRRVQRDAPCRGGEGVANLELVGIDRCDRPNLVCNGPNVGPKLAPV